MVSKIRGAMVYPGIVLAVMVAVGVFMMVTIVPQVAKLYSDMKKTLPVLTSILIGISNFVINFWWLTLILLALAIFFARQYVRTEAGSRLLDNLKQYAAIQRYVPPSLYGAVYAYGTDFASYWRTDAGYAGYCR